MTSTPIQANTIKYSAKSLLKSSLLFSVGFSTLAMATSASAQSNDEVIVTGIRQTLQNALIEKRESDSLIEVILAEDIGKLPDQNLAEVLENITGVQITRTAGVGTGVQIRGTDDNRTEINGVTTLGSGSGRGGISFEDVSASIIAGLEVIKAPEAKTTEGAVGGTINLRTIRPLDLKGTLASIRVQGEYSELSDTVSPRISGSLGNKWENAKGQEIGVVLSGSYTEQEATSFRPRVDRDNPIFANGSVTAAGAPGPDFDFLGIQFLNQELENFEFENINFAGSVEARPTPELKLYFDAIVNDQERAQDSLRIQGSGVSSVDTVNVPDTFETVDFGSLDGQDLGSIQAALSGTIQPNLAQDDDDPNLRFSSDTGARQTTSEIYRLGAEWERDNLTLRVEGSTTSSDSSSPNLSTTLNFINPNPLTPLDGSSNDNSVPFAFDLSDGLAFGIDFNSPFAPTVADLLNPANVVLDAVTVGADTQENSEDAFRVDASYDLRDSNFSSFAGNFFTSVDAGYRYNDISSEFNDIGSSFSTGSIANSPNGLLFEELLVAGPDNIEPSGNSDLAFTDFLLVDPDAAFNDPEGTLDILQAALDTTNGSVGDPTASQFAFFNIGEETHAIYGQLGFEYGFLKGNAGLRWVDTTVTSTGNSEINGVVSLVETTGSYNEFLPRVNLALTPHEDFLIRASWSEDINRPDFGDLNTSVSFPTGPNNAVSIGNPSLSPETVTSYDASVDWYFAPSAVLSVGIFHKSRGDLFVNTVEDAPVDANGFRDITAPCEGGGIFNPVPDRNVLSDTIGNGLCVPISTTVNDTANTTQTGVEVAFQYDFSNWEDRLGSFAWASGFGVLANYTYQDFSGGEVVLDNDGNRSEPVFALTTGGTGIIEARQGLLNNSENAYNLTGYYDKFGLSARLRYTWRDSFRTTDTAAGASLNSTFGFPVVTASRGQLNGSINYDVTDNFTVGVEGVNLTTSNIEQFCVNDGALLCFQGIPDRRITFGGSYTF